MIADTIYRSAKLSDVNLSCELPASKNPICREVALVDSLKNSPRSCKQARPLDHSSTKLKAHVTTRERKLIKMNWMDGSMMDEL